MDIIITMAGMGNRFKTLGHTCPKHEIIARDRSLFEWSLASLSSLFQHRFVFIVRKDFYNRKFIIDKCQLLGIKAFDIIELDRLTSGQAETAYYADSLISSDSPVAIYNIDTFVESTQMDLSEMHSYDGYIPVFEAEGDKWSFIQINSQQEITDVVEKVRVSNLATIGFYYFKSWRLFKEHFLLFSNEITHTYKESYIAPIYKYMLQNNCRLGYTVIPSDSVHVLGTPEDVTVFDPYYLNKNLTQRH